MASEPKPGSCACLAEREVDGAVLPTSKIHPGRALILMVTRESDYRKDPELPPGKPMLIATYCPFCGVRYP